MHAFDLDRLEGGIVVRTAEAGEEIELLNDQTVTLARITW
jgi:phenylalanyl-tRNA synthetase beta chain